MREKRLTTVPPCIRENEFEDFLATDDILVDFFNEFLSLPAFAETIKYNADFGIFEVASDAPEQIENQLKKLLYEQKPRNPIYDVTRPTKSESPVSKDLSRQPLAPPPPHLNIDLNYAAMCLDREQAITWIKKERLPAFLESDCYFEYRLAKLISQVEWSRTGVNFVIDKKYYPWFRKMPPPPEAFEEDEDDVIMKKFYVSLGQATVTQTKDWFTLAKQREHMITTDSITRPVSSSHVRFSFEPSKMSSSNIDFRTKEMLPTASSILLNATVYSSGHAELESKLKKKQSPTGIPLLQQARARRSIDEGHSVSVPDTPSHTMLRAYVEQNWDSAPQEQMCDDLARYQELACFRTVDEFTLAYIQYILKNSVAVITGMPLKLNPTDVNFNRVSRVLVYEIEDSDSFMEPLLEHTPLLEDDTVERESEISTKSEKDNTETRAAWCISHKTYDIGNRHEFERFKGFIKGTLGERYWWLWVDIERLKALRDPKRQKRQLDRMKKIYLVSNGDYFLTSEVLQKLNLEDGDRWNLHNLRRIQSEVVKPLLLYWGPRFCVIHTAAIQTLNRKLKIWHSRQQKPRMDVDPFPQMVSLLPLRAKSCMPKIAHQREEISSAPPLSKGAVVDMYSQRPPRLLSAILPRSQSAVQEDPDGLVDLADISRQRPATACSNVTHLTVFPDKMDYLKPQLDRKYTYAEVIPGKTSPDISELGSSTMERMLQSLNTENRAGYVFTDFCEKSGNMVWKNSTYFWFDLQDYHQLFYQETLHPFKLCKQAQFLYANYIAPSANMDIGLQQATKNEIYSKIEPPFEDLFDSAEEYILTLLLVPWRKMVEQDKESYRKVELVEETRQLESVYFRKLQALHEKSISKKSEILAVEEDKVPERSDSTTVAERPAQILPEADKPYSIAELLQKRLDLEQFRIFLEQQSASVDLMCWIDIEQFRRMLHKNKAQREEKSKEIKNKYLNKKYFFGPDSPATKEEQEQIMKLGGGWGQILHEQVCPKILLEVQKSIQARLEKKWLPLYFSSEESGPKKKPKPHLEDAAEDILIQRFEKKIEPWKHVDNKWVSSSQEIITFRKALLNPITAFQFQRFVSLKGDLLENGVIFWQEVQKYKDMCHSHCDDAIIQKKITEIIRCFINSSIPPAIQIDIPEEQAQKIIEQRKELGPYVFREAQMTIFALLFKFWPKFCEFRSNLADENILPLLDKQREKTLEKMKKAKEAEEKVPRKRSAVSVKTGAATTMTTGLESRRTSKSELSSTPSFSGFGRQLSWNYSKYLEALQQERVLLKIQEDLEKKAVNSSAYAGVSSIFTFKSDLHPVPEKAVYPTPFTSAFVKQQRTHPPKDNERTPKL